MYRVVLVDDEKLIVEGLNLYNSEGVHVLKDISFTANGGEILGIAGIAGGIFLFSRSNLTQGLLFVSAGLVLAGLSVYAFYACKFATKALAKASAGIALWVKRCFVRKEAD